VLLSDSDRAVDR